MDDRDSSSNGDRDRGNTILKWSLVPFHEIAEEVARKAVDYCSEIENVNLDWDYYLAASYAGRCVAVVGHDSGGVFAGGGVFFIENDPNKKHILEAVNGMVFLDRKYRGRPGWEFFQKAHEFLKSIGVQKISYALKDDRIGRILRSGKYKPEYTIWSAET